MTFEYENTAPVRWSTRRHELLWFLYELASPLIQQQRWIEGKSRAPGDAHGFSFVVNFFFDDTELAQRPEHTLGDILLDELEVTAVRRIGQELERVYDEIGPGQPDIEYISAARWPKVIIAAKEAYRLLRPRVRGEGDNLVPPELTD
jgi:hypothetical protein